MARSGAAIQLTSDQSEGKPKKIHWTQTPRGKKIMAQNARKRAKLRKGQRNGAKSTHAQEVDHSQSISFLAGIISEKISNYAASSGIPRATLAAGVATILRHQEGG